MVDFLYWLTNEPSSMNERYQPSILKVSLQLLSAEESQLSDQKPFRGSGKLSVNKTSNKIYLNTIISHKLSSRSCIYQYHPNTLAA